MSDNRIRVNTTKQIDLAELDAGLGNYGLVSDNTCVIAVQGSPVTKHQLQTAIDAYDGNRVATKYVQQQRHSAYAAESDPLYFLWQRGEGTQADWLTAVADIRTRFPMPDA